MNKRLIRLGIVAVVGLSVITAGVWVLARMLGNGQTHYHGKTLGEWATQLHSLDSQARAQAAEGVEKFVVPRLTDVMLHDTDDSHSHFALKLALNKLPGIAINLATAPDRRRSAAQILGQLGPAAKSAIPALIQAAKSSDDAVRAAAVMALGNIHDQADAVVPVLVGCLDTGDLTQNAASALGEFGPSAKSAVSNLVGLLKVPNQDKRVRTAVVGALKKIDPGEASKAASVGP